MADTKKDYPYYYVFTLALVLFWALYALREYDDNTLVSWRWCFHSADLALLYALLLTGLLIAFFAARYPLYEKHPAAFLFILSYAVSALSWQVPEVIVDTARYFTAAKQLQLNGAWYFLSEWGRGVHAWTDMPLVPFIYGLVFKVFGESRVCIQAVNSLFFSFTVLVTYHLGRELWDRETGFLGALMLLGVPYLLTQVPLMLVDVPTMFFLTFALYAFIKALRRGGAVWTLIAAFAIFLAFYSKYSTWLMLSVLAPAVAVHLKDGAGRALRRTGAVLLAAGALIAVVLVLNHDVMSEQMRLLVQYQRPGLRRWGESFCSTYFFQTHPYVSLAAAASVWVAFKRKNPAYIITAWLIALTFLMDIERIRYVSVIFPMFTLCAAYGLSVLGDAGLRRYIAMSAVAVSLVVAFAAYLPFLNGISLVNLKDAGRFLDTLEVQRAEVYTLPQEVSSGSTAIAVPILDLFTDKDIVYLNPDPRPSKDIKTSSLRFTWEFESPPYYEGGAETGTTFDNSALVVISGFPPRDLPGEFEIDNKGFRNVRVFKTNNGVFRFGTAVTVYY